MRQVAPRRPRQGAQPLRQVLAAAAASEPDALVKTWLRRLLGGDWARGSNPRK
jgi:hypothetical protein